MYLGPYDNPDDYNEGLETVELALGSCCHDRLRTLFESGERP
jgi:hypothetical protein